MAIDFSNIGLIKSRNGSFYKNKIDQRIIGI